MQTALTREIFWLTSTVTLSALFWVPYIINRLKEHGVWPALRNPQPDLRPRAAWAERMMRAHANAVENLVIFAPLVLALHVTSLNTPSTASACMVYFFARLAHYVIYTLGLPLLRTVAFFIGFVSQMVLAMTLFGVN
jgi:uncharacterized MAPEG superfamily protein